MKKYIAGALFAITAWLSCGYLLAGSINSGIVFGPLYVTGSGIFNQNALPLPVPPIGTAIEVGTADGVIPHIQAYSFGNSNAPQFETFFSQGTNAAKQALVANRTIGRYIFNGYDGSAYQSVGQIIAQTSENFISTTNYGTNVIITGTSPAKGLATNNVSYTFSGNGHLNVNASSTTIRPTINTGCGTGSSIDTDSPSDNIIRVFTGSGVFTSCKINFGYAYVNTPICVVANTLDMVPYAVLETVNDVTITAAAPITVGSAFKVICFAKG